MRKFEPNPFMPPSPNPAWQRLTGRIALAAMLCGLCHGASASVHFEDVSGRAGMAADRPTAGLAWGDLDGDGWPDLWVSNHHGMPPSLYLNRRDGTFAEVAAERLHAPWLASSQADASEAPDFHGAAWADFDGNGTDDLVVLSGGGAGRGASANHLFVNQGGRLVDHAGEFGVDYPLGRGRTPLWLDADLDGRLDLLLMNKRRAEAPSALFLQSGDRFQGQGGASEFDVSPDIESAPLATGDPLSRLAEWLRALAGPPVRPLSALGVDDAFAQLADLDGDDHAELVLYDRPTRAYRISGEALASHPARVAADELRGIQDGVFADFDGDGRLDWFLVRAQPWVSDVRRVDDRRVVARLAGGGNKPLAVEFAARGAVLIHLHRPWVDASDPERQVLPTVYVGARRHELDGSVLRLTPDDPGIDAQAPVGTEAADHVSVRYDPARQRWRVLSRLPVLSFSVEAEQSIDEPSTEGFTPSSGALTDVMLLWRSRPQGGFSESDRNGRKADGSLLQRSGEFEQSTQPVFEHPTACVSAVAADFDNDMDVDLYLACTGPTGNLSNRLYLNDGAGNFSEPDDLDEAHGAAGGRAGQVTTVDFDQDGFVDLFLTNGAGPPPFGSGPHQLLRNLGNENHWLQIDLQGSRSNPDGIGAVVWVESGGRRQVRQHDGGMHSFAQNHRRLHFGLGPNTRVDRVVIRWPSGREQTLSNLPADQIVRVRED